MRRRQHQTLKSRLNPVQEHCRRELVGFQKHPRETERVSLQGLGSGETRIISWNRTVAKQDQEKVVKPVQMSLERGFQGSVKRFHEVVR